MKFKKLALVAAIMVFVTACAGDVPQLLPFISTEPSDIDFEGLTFRIFKEGQDDANFDLSVEKEPDYYTSFRDEMYLERIDELEKTYNCNIESSYGVVGDLTGAFAADLPIADIFECRLKHFFNVYQAGYILPLNEIPNVDTSDGKYGSQEFLDSFTWNGDIVGTYGQYWGFSPLGFTNALYYNPEIFIQINEANPAELYEAGEWTWDSFERIAEACSSISTEDKPVTVSVHSQYFPRMLFLSNGCNYIEMNENGKFYYGLTTPAAIEALNFSAEFGRKGYLANDPGDHMKIVENFSQGHYAIVCEVSGYGVRTGTLATSMENGLGYMYAPIGPSGTVEDVTRGLMSQDNAIWSIIKEKTDDLDSLGNFLELFYSPLSDEEDPMAWLEEYKTFNFFDDISAEVFVTQSTNIGFDRVAFYDYGSYRIFDAIHAASKSGAVVENLQSLESAVNAVLDQGINAGK